MGAWGARPYENDAACDWFVTTIIPVSDSIDKLLSRGVTADDYDEVRAAAWLLTKIGRTGVYGGKLEEHLDKLHSALQTIKNDTVYVDTWFKQDEFLKDLNDLIQQLQRVCKWNNVVLTF